MVNLALFETADGMTRWQEVEDRPPLTIRFAILKPFQLGLDSKDDPPLMADRSYELRERRQLPDGRQYFYYRECFNDGGK